MKNKLYLFIALLVITCNLALAQGLKQIVSVNYEKQTLGEVLDEIEQDFGLKFSYVPSAVPLDSTVTLKLTNQSLGVLLNVLSRQAGLEYKVVKDHIAFFHSIPSVENKGQTLNKKIGSQVTDNTSVTENENPVRETGQPTIDTFPPGIEYIHLASIAQTQYFNINHRSNIPVLPNVKDKYTKISASTDSKNTWAFRLGLVVSVDFYYLSGNSEENKDFEYNTGVNYSIGLSAKLNVKEHWGIVLLAMYSTKNFDLHYNFQTMEPDDSFVPDKTVYQQAYLDFPLLFHYVALAKGNWSLSGEAGVVPCFLLKDMSQTYHKDGSKMETPEFITMKILPQLYGAQLNAMAGYQVNQHLSFTLTSGWRQYFNGITQDDLSTKMGLFSCSAGIKYCL